MSSLWTPGGEHKVPRPDEPDSGSGDQRDSPRGGSPPSRESTRDPRDLGGVEDREPTEEELRELARQLAAAPPEDVVANHCYGLFELAALHLSQTPVNVPAARLAIDAMGLLVDGLGTRLGAHAGALADGLTQLRLAFVRITDALAASAAGASAAGPSAAGASAAGESAAGESVAGASAGGESAGKPSDPSGEPLAGEPAGEPSGSGGEPLAGEPSASAGE